jgi:hypothetical protein
VAEPAAYDVAQGARPTLAPLRRDIHEHLTVAQGTTLTPEAKRITLEKRLPRRSSASVPEPAVQDAGSEAYFFQGLPSTLCVALTVRLFHLWLKCEDDVPGRAPGDPLARGDTPSRCWTGMMGTALLYYDTASRADARATTRRAPLRCGKIVTFLARRPRRRPPGLSCPLTS